MRIVAVIQVGVESTVEGARVPGEQQRRLDLRLVLREFLPILLLPEVPPCVNIDRVASHKVEQLGAAGGGTLAGESLEQINVALPVRVKLLMHMLDDVGLGAKRLIRLAELTGEALQVARSGSSL